MEKDVLVIYVNGTRHEVRNPSVSKTLLEYLREDLCLTGTKNSCLEGACGACTVTVSQWDRQEKRVTHSAVNACITRLCSLHGTAITTVEGLGSVKEGLHPVQERIYKAHGSQCGFCTPGMVMSMSSLLREEDSIRDQDIHRALQGNLCRCTGYRAIIEGFRTFCNEEDPAAFQAQANGNQGDEQHVVPTFDSSTFKPYDRQWDPHFPEELKNDSLLGASLKFVSSNGGPTWHKPSSLADLKSLLQNHDIVEFVAGGTGKFKKPTCEAAIPSALIQITGIQELQLVETRPDGILIGSGLTMKAFKSVCLKEVQKTGNAILKCISEVLDKWVSAQVRNVATIGGHLGWAHPCSDLIPIFMATGCSLEVMDKTGRRRSMAVDENLFRECYQISLADSDVMLGLVVPHCKPGSVCHFYRRSRRKEFDLAVANACFFGSLDKGVVQDIKVAVGGMEGAFPGAKASPPSLALGTMGYLEGKSIKLYDKKVLAGHVFSDLFVDERAPGKFSNYRRCLVAVFAERFLKDSSQIGTQRNFSEDLPVRSQTLFEVPGKDQDNQDPIHRPVSHNWAAEQAAGVATYIDDMRHIEGEVQVVPIHSELPHALVEKIDFAEALKASGVVGVLTAEDVPNNSWALGGGKDEALVAKEAMYTGQVIGALVCDSAKAGRAARRLVKVTYKDLPHVLFMENLEGKFRSEAKIGPKLEIQRNTDLGTVDKTVTVAGTLKCGGQEHLYLEPHRALAVPETEKDEMTIYASSQYPMGLHKLVCETLQIPRHKVIVKTKRAGGGFGGKERPQVFGLAALAARKFGRPARVVLSTTEDFKVTGHRQATAMDYKITADQSGRVTNMIMEGRLNAGASLDLTAAVGTNLITGSDGAYTWRNFEGKVKCLKTNTPSNTAFRGFGAPEGHLLAEVAIQHLAHELKLDIMKVKEANLTKEGDLLHYCEQKVEGSSLSDCWKEMLKRSDYFERRKEVAAFNQENKDRKRGLTAIPMKFPISLPRKGNMQGNAYIRIYTDGTILLSHGGVEMGQGLHTKMMQVCSSALGVPMSKIHIDCTGTDTVVNATATVASTGADLNGPAVLDACKQINERLAQIKKNNPNGSWESWIETAYSGLVNLSAVGHYRNPEVTLDMAKQTGIRATYFTYGAGCVQVEVDCTTGDVTVLTAELVLDLGKSLNPAIDIGQCEGAFLQGLGWATTEQLLLCPKKGELLTTSPSTYKIPTIADVPKNFNVTLLTHVPGRPTNACYSSKGVGEPPLVLAMGLSNAVREAVASYRADHGNHDWFHFDIPMTADKIRMAATDEYTEAAEKLTKGSEPIGIET